MGNEIRRRLRGRAAEFVLRHRGESEGSSVIRARVGRLMAAASAVVMTAVLSAGVATAAPPKWVMDVDLLPAEVTPGANAGFSVTITNNGPSNISALFLTTNSDATPVYLTSSRPGACNELGTLSGELFCSFGAVNDDDFVTIVVAYETDSSENTFPISFQANTTGATFSDVKGRSHGDLLTTPVVTPLNSNRNFAGFFSSAPGGAISNNAQLSGNNKQATALSNLPAGVEGTVEDGTGTTGNCVSEPGINCALLEGEWSEVFVAGGDTLDESFFVIMKFRNVGEPTAIFHSFGPPADQELIQECSETGGSVPCFTWDDATDTATIETFHNGSYIRVR